jgi:hypothetical protein
MSEGLAYPGQQTVLDAFLAPVESLPGKINIAERAIAVRLVDSNIGEDERIAVKDALQALRVLLAEATPKDKEEIQKKDIA